LKTVFCYGDSNTWGYIAETGKRYPRHIRWPGVLQKVLGEKIHVTEEGLPGRTTVWDDPFRQGRNGKAFLATLLESHAPVDLVVIMLGTNDMKHIYASTAYYAACGVRELVNIVNKTIPPAYNEPPQVLIVSPPRIECFSESIKLEFNSDVVKESKDFAMRYREVAEECRCFFLDSSQIVGNIFADGVHLGEHDHIRLGKSVAEVVQEILKL